MKTTKLYQFSDEEYLGSNQESVEVDALDEIREKISVEPVSYDHRDDDPFFQKDQDEAEASWKQYHSRKKRREDF